MGFDKKHVNKEIILHQLKNDKIEPLLREIRIDKLFNSEVLVLDHWGSNFYNNLNPSEREYRKKLNARYKFSSGFEFIKDEYYKNLKSLSESLISLMGQNAMWLDIFMVSEKLGIKFNEEEAGKFSIMRDKCIESIIDYFDGYLS